MKTRVRGPGMREDRGERPETKRRRGRGSDGGPRAAREKGYTDGTGWSDSARLRGPAGPESSLRGPVPSQGFCPTVARPRGPGGDIPPVSGPRVSGEARREEARSARTSGRAGPHPHGPAMHLPGEPPRPLSPAPPVPGPRQASVGKRQRLTVRSSGKAPMLPAQADSPAASFHGMEPRGRLVPGPRRPVPCGPGSRARRHLLGPPRRSPPGRPARGCGRPWSASPRGGPRRRPRPTGFQVPPPAPPGFPRPLPERQVTAGDRRHPGGRPEGNRGHGLASAGWPPSHGVLGSHFPPRAGQSQPRWCLPASGIASHPTPGLATSLKLLPIVQPLRSQTCITLQGDCLQRSCITPPIPHPGKAALLSPFY